MNISSTLHGMYTQRLAASRDALSLADKQAKEWAELSDKHGADAIGQVAPHIRKVVRAHGTLARRAKAVANESREAAALHGLTALRGLNKTGNAKPPGKAIRPKYPVQQMSKPMGTTKV
jgi:hypothetical protein